MVNRIYKREGLKGFYKGYLTELLHHSISALFFLPLYQIVREKYGIELHEWEYLFIEWDKLCYDILCLLFYLIITQV